MVNPREINLSDKKWLPGEKTTVKGLDAAVSSDNAVVTYSMLKILSEGGNAIDAGIAGCLLQGVLEPYMTNYTGTVTFLCYIASEGKYYQLDSAGTVPYDLPFHMPVPPGMGEYSDLPSRSVIPGFMPGLKALYDRFGTMKWSRLCEEAVWWAEKGHHVSQFESEINFYTQRFITYFPEGRKYYMPDGHMPIVGNVFKNADMERTVKAVAEEGPDYMITGAWADSFIKKANEMGWKIEKRHMQQTPPRWIEPLRFKIGEYEIISLAPPQQQGVFLSIVLGILEKLDIGSVEPYSAKHLFYMSHALRLGLYLCGFFNDPGILSFQTETFIDDNFHEYLAKLIKGMIPRVDLTSHMDYTMGNLVKYEFEGSGAGIPTPLGMDSHQKQPSGSCELSIVDKDGNWVQMMNTLQSGGIPGMVVDGVPMVGSHAVPNIYEYPMAYYHTKGARIRLPLGNTMVVKNGKPVLQLGSPGNVHCTVPQVLCNYLFFGMTPYEAIRGPRMLPLNQGGVLLIEDRIPLSIQNELKSMGIETRVCAAWDYHMGSFQTCYIDRETNELATTVDPRRCGVADGLKAK